MRIFTVKVETWFQSLENAAGWWVHGTDKRICSAELLLRAHLCRSHLQTPICQDSSHQPSSLSCPPVLLVSILHGPAPPLHAKPSHTLSHLAAITRSSSISGAPGNIYTHSFAGPTLQVPLDFHWPHWWRLKPQGHASYLRGPGQDVRWRLHKPWHSLCRGAGGAPFLTTHRKVSAISELENRRASCVSLPPLQRSFTRGAPSKLAEPSHRPCWLVLFSFMLSLRVLPVSV